MTKASSAAPKTRVAKTAKTAKTARSTATLANSLKTPFAKLFLATTLLLLILTPLTLLPFHFLSVAAFYLFGLWALLFLLFCLRAVIKVANIKLTKPFLIISLFTLLATFAFYAFTLINSKQIYTWDQYTYYGKQLDLLDSFGITSADGDFLTGVKTIAKTTYASDYGDFLLSFTSAPFSLTSMTAENFILTYSLFEVLPTIFAFLLLAEKALSLFSIKNRSSLKPSNLKTISLKLSNLKAVSLKSSSLKATSPETTKPLALSALVLLTFPLLHKAASYGQPDIFGLFWFALILILCLGYFFEKIDPPRWFLLILFIFLTIITRRWYLFLLIAFFLSYGVAIIIHHKSLLAKAPKKSPSAKALLKSLKPALTFVLIAAASLLIALLPFIIRTLKADYATSYAAWNTGGLAFEITKHQIPFLGYFLLALILLGFLVGIANKTTRTSALITLSTLALSLLLFTHVQNLWYHQSLILVPAYLAALFFLIINITNTKIAKRFRTLLASVVVLILALNYFGALSENSNFYNNRFFGSISLKPIVYKSYDQLTEIDHFILKNTTTETTATAEIENAVYPNFASSEYSADTLMSLMSPNRSLEKIICHESSIDSVHGFPTCILNAKYVIISNKIIDATGAGTSKTIPKITELFTTENPVSAHYEPIKTFSLADDLEFTFYERIAPTDSAELDYWEIAFPENDFPAEKFADRIKTYKEQNL